MFTTKGEHSNLIIALVQPDILYHAINTSLTIGISILLALLTNRQNRSSSKRFLWSALFSIAIASLIYWFLDYQNILKITQAYHKERSTQDGYGKMNCVLPSWNLRKEHSSHLLKSEYCWGPCCILPLE